jgi:hypothetical protein
LHGLGTEYGREPHKDGNSILGIHEAPVYRSGPRANASLAICVVFSRVILMFSIGIQVSQERIRTRSSLVYWCFMDAQFAVAVPVWLTAIFSSQSVQDVVPSIPVSPLIVSDWGSYQNCPSVHWLPVGRRYGNPKWDHLEEIQVIHDKIKYPRTHPHHIVVGNGCVGCFGVVASAGVQPNEKPSHRIPPFVPCKASWKVSSASPCKANTEHVSL